MVCNHTCGPLTTVGYGAIYSITARGIKFTFCILVVGLGIVSVAVGIIVTAFQKSREMGDDR